MEEEATTTPDVIEPVEDKNPQPTVWVKYALWALVVIAILLYLLVSGWGGYAFVYVKCGVKQPLLAYTIEKSQIYYPPDNRRYSAPGEGEFFNNYYCTEPQAVAAGFLRAGP